MRVWAGDCALGWPFPRPVAWGQQRQPDPQFSKSFSPIDSMPFVHPSFDSCTVSGLQRALRLVQAQLRSSGPVTHQGRYFPSLLAHGRQSCSYDASDASSSSLVSALEPQSYWSIGCAGAARQRHGYGYDRLTLQVGASQDPGPGHYSPSGIYVHSYLNNAP